MASLDTGCQIWWSIDGTARTTELSCVRVGPIYWLGGRVRRRFTSAADLRSVLAIETAGLTVDVGKPNSKRLVDPLTTMTHMLVLDLGPGPGYELSAEVRRREDGRFEWIDITQVFDGMGARGSTTTVVDEKEARARIEKAYDEGYTPTVAPMTR